MEISFKTNKENNNIKQMVKKGRSHNGKTKELHV
jgi:hypothetical protein